MMMPSSRNISATSTVESSPPPGVAPEVKNQPLVAGVDDARQLLIEVAGRLLRELLNLQVGEVVDGIAILALNLVREHRWHLDRRTLDRYLFLCLVFVTNDKRHLRSLRAADLLDRVRHAPALGGLAVYRDEHVAG